MTSVVFGGVAYKTHLTVKREDDKESAESSDKNKGATDNQNTDIKQAEINREHWKTASSVGMRFVEVNKGHEVNMPGPPLKEVLNLHKLNVSLLETTVMVKLDEGVSLKKQLFHGCALGGVRQLYLGLKEVIWKSDDYKQLGNILGHDLHLLETLDIDMDLFHHARELPSNPDSSVKAVFRGIGNLKKLENLNISFNYSKEIVDYDNVFGDFGSQLGKLGQYNKIDTLKISMQQNKIDNAEMLRLFRGISEMKSLKSLTIDLRGSHEFDQTGFDPLVGPLKKLNNLSSLTMNLDSDIDATVLRAALSAKDSEKPVKVDITSG
ncbi:hypothetical protein [Pandoraea oxalativorans]|nr:hypothetical protein [Pandoraea oxalativorans]